MKGGIEYMPRKIRIRKPRPRKDRPHSWLTDPKMLEIRPEVVGLLKSGIIGAEVIRRIKEHYGIELTSTHICTLSRLIWAKRV